MNTNKIRVFIISQQVLFRQGIEHAISSIEDIEIVGTADYHNGVIDKIDSIMPDVAIIDVDFPSDDSLTLARKIKRQLPSIGTIIITSAFNDEHLFQALKAQAAAFLSKDTTQEKLIDTIRCVARHEYPINESLFTRPNVADKVLQQFQELSLQSETIISPLTRRETEVLDYIAQGYLNKQIAAELDVTDQTIKNHVTSILRKLNANARTEAVVIALKQGILTLD